MEGEVTDQESGKLGFQPGLCLLLALPNCTVPLLLCPSVSSSAHWDKNRLIERVGRMTKDHSH